MKHHQKPQRPPETSQDRFRTPTRPSPLGTSKSTTSKRTGLTNTPAPSRPEKRNWPSSARAQSTLTQIDFVTQPTQPDDDELDYIDAAAPHENTHKDEPVQVVDGSDDDAADQQPLRARSGISRFESNDDHPKRRRKSTTFNGRASSHGLRKSQTPKPSIGGKGKRTSSEKPGTKRDKTLTQMDFVRRYITIDDDDDDVNMGYIQPAPKNPGCNETKEPSSDKMDTTRLPPPPSAKRRRVFEAELDLSTGEPISESGGAQDEEPRDRSQKGPACDGPTTPQKPRKLEIPSSQSPESPGLAIITSSQFRSATRSPLKQRHSNIAHNPDNDIKEESPGHQGLVEDSQDPADLSPAKTPTPTSPHANGCLNPQMSPAHSANFCVPSTELESQQSLHREGNEHKLERTQRERTVVYETDAETEYSDSGDEEGNPVAPSQPHRPREDVLQAAPESPDDSQELPLPAVQSTPDLDSGPLPEAPMSDASIYYQRMQAATQFPHEPIPTLNTQKLSELFPNEGSTQYRKPPSLPSSPKFRGPFLQTQTQSQDPDQTEIVPESSPVREQESNSTNQDEAVFQRPHPPEAVQVESSQPVDRGNTRPNGIISRSQLLTSSVMESVPLPQFWMGSQDSVGEPYSLPDR